MEARIPTSFEELKRDLQLSARMHQQLRLRVVGMAVIALGLLGLSAYYLYTYSLSWVIAGGTALMTFILGFVFFWKIRQVEWDATLETFRAARIDFVGVVIFILYIGFELLLRRLFSAEFGDTIAATTYLLVAIGATLLGRSAGTLMAIKRLRADGIGRD